LALTNVSENLLRREADIAVRMVRPEQEALLAKKIGTVRFGLYAHRDYLARCGTPRTVEDLRGHTLVGFDRNAALIRALRDAPALAPREDLAFRSDSALAQLAMVRAGFGIGRAAAVASVLGRDVVPVLREQYGIEVGVWIVMHEDMRENRRMRLMFDHL